MLKPEFVVRDFLLCKRQADKYSRTSLLLGYVIRHLFIIISFLQIYNFLFNRNILWIENPYNNTVREYKSRTTEYAARNDRKVKEYKFWQEGVDCQEIFLYDYLQQKLNYIHNKPVKEEFVYLPEEYEYSSEGYYAEGKGILDVEVIK